MNLVLKPARKVSLLFLLGFIGLSAFANDQFKVIDKYSASAPRSAETSVAALAHYLKRGSNNELEKARAVYAWIASHVSYDWNAYTQGSYTDVTGSGVLSNKTAVCEGFSNLYKALADSMGLTSEKVTGYAKGYGYTDKESVAGTNHAWNAVKIDGRWRLMDVTWAACESTGGSVTDAGQGTVNDYWFDTDPYEFLFSHLPGDQNWTLIPQQISLKLYEKMPYVNPGIFKLGFDARSLLGKAMLNNLPRLPQTYHFTYHLKAIHFPLNYNITAMPECTFVIESDEELDIAFINNSDWHHMYKNGRQYTLKMPLQKGKLAIAVRGKKGGSYSTVLEYQVVKG